MTLCLRAGIRWEHSLATGKLGVAGAERNASLTGRVCGGLVERAAESGEQSEPLRLQKDSSTGQLVPALLQVEGEETF